MDMAKQQKPGRISRKILIILLCSGVALGLAYYVSRISFVELLGTVNKISTPDEKLRLVSKISRDILQQDQLQRSQLFLTNNKQYSGFVTESNTIIHSLDSLKMLYTNNTVQQQRIDSILKLIRERDKLFISYVQVRKRLVDNREFTDRIQHINQLIQTNPSIDKTVVTTEKKVKTTTPARPAAQAQDERGFLARLFGVKKEETGISETPRPIVHEELNIQVDSIESIPKQVNQIKINQAIRDLRLQQQQQSSSFINREAELTTAGSVLVNSIFNILHEVEQEAMLQMEQDNQNAQIVVNQSVDKIAYILIGFFVIVILMTVLVFSDIRKSNNYRLALEQAKEEAEYHSMAKQRFLSNMSHEIRTPLQSIIGFTEQMRLNDPTQKSRLNIIHNASEHLLQIVNEVLDYNRIHSGNFHFSTQVFPIKEVLQEVMDAMNPQAERKHLQFESIVKIAGTGYVEGDVFRLKQILFNLISNAIKFTDKGSVKVGLSAVEYGADTQINLSVADTGSGIEPQDIQRIFNEFEQAGNFNSGVNFGSGLGLSIVKALVTNLDGEIKIKSEPGVGSTFKVRLKFPAAEKTQATPKVQDNLIPVNEFKSEVWVVDDDAFILQLCDTILNHHKIPHRCFSSPLTLLDTPWEAPISHVIMDMRMPEMHGQELSRLLRRRIPKNVKLIACTAQALPEERQEILQMGFDALLLKPFKEADLLAILGVKDNSIQEGNRSILPQSAFWEEKSDRDLIIGMFIKDTEKDWLQLRTFTLEQDKSGIEMTAHRMAGRTAQMGKEDIAIKLRKMEIDARCEELPSEEELSKIESALQSFIDDLKQELEIV